MMPKQGDNDTLGGEECHGIQTMFETQANKMVVLHGKGMSTKVLPNASWPAQQRKITLKQLVWISLYMLAILCIGHITAIIIVKPESLISSRHTNILVLPGTCMHVGAAECDRCSICGEGSSIGIFCSLMTVPLMSLPMILLLFPCTACKDQS